MQLQKQTVQNWWNKAQEDEKSCTSDFIYWGVLL